MNVSNSERCDQRLWQSIKTVPLSINQLIIPASSQSIHSYWDKELFVMLGLTVQQMSNELGVNVHIESNEMEHGLIPGTMSKGLPSSRVYIK